MVGILCRVNVSIFVQINNWSSCVPISILCARPTTPSYIFIKAKLCTTFSRLSKNSLYSRVPFRNRHHVFSQLISQKYNPASNTLSGAAYINSREIVFVRRTFSFLFAIFKGTTRKAKNNDNVNKINYPSKTDSFFFIGMDFPQILSVEFVFCFFHQPSGRVAISLQKKTQNNVIIEVLILPNCKHCFDGIFIFSPEFFCSVSMKTKIGIWIELLLKLIWKNNLKPKRHFLQEDSRKETEKRCQNILIFINRPFCLQAPLGFGHFVQTFFLHKIELLL